MTMRDWRAGELTMLLLALVLAVSAFASVGFLADRLYQGLERDARSMIAADFVVRADHPIDALFTEQAHALGLRTANTAIFASMITASVSSQNGSAQPSARLAAIKAVSSAYPLRGAVRIANAPNAPNAPDHPATHIPEPGTVWADAVLLDALHVRVGDSVMVGSRALTVSAVITRELDRGPAFVNFAPRLIMRADELASTGLTGYGSRVTYRLLVAGSDAAVAQFAAFAHAHVDGGKMRGVRLESLQEGQPQVRQTLDRAGHFLILVSLLSALLAAVAIAMAAHRYMRRHLDGCAMMRCFGLDQQSLRALLTLQLLLLGVAGGVVGVVLGYAGHGILLMLLGNLIDVPLPPPTLRPAWQGIMTALILLAGFALPPLLPLTRVPPVSVLRREWGRGTRTAWLAYGFGIALFTGLLISMAGDWKLGGIVALGFIASICAFSGIAWAVLWMVSRLVRSQPINAGLGWRHALAALERRRLASALQIAALSIGLMCLLLIAITRHDLIQGWRHATPPDAPNEFLIDIQPHERQGIEAYLTAHGVTGAVFEPMVKGRLIAINGQPVNPDAYPDGQARRLVDREFNLSYRSVLPADNRIIAGRWYGDTDKPQISIEAGLAKLLDIKTGDVLSFDVTGLSIDAPVTSIRKLDWGSFKANFFILLPPVALAGFPATYITSFHLPPGRRAVIDGLIAAYPGVTVIDIGPILDQLQLMLEQVIGAVQFLFILTLAGGVLVLYAVLAGTRDERAGQAALFRALGASHRQVRAMQAAEFIVVGALAGLMAAAGAQLLGMVLAVRIFDFYLSFNPWLLPAGMAAGIACTSLGGWLSLRQVLRRPVIQSLRDI